MVLTYHRSDFQKLPNESEVVAALRRAGLTRGLYHFPWGTSPKEMRSPEMIERFKEGPVGILAIVPNEPPPMGKLLAIWFAYGLLVSALVGVVAGRSLAPGSDAMLVACVTATAAFLAYGASTMVDSVWKGYPWGITAKNALDGLLYSLATAAVFAWLWPG
jgi:hypothetical protein